MSVRIEKGKNGDFWANKLPEGISLIRPFDKYTIIAAVAGSILALVYGIYLTTFSHAVIYDVVPWMTIPFFVCGLIYYVRVKYWILLVFIAIGVVLWFVGIPQSAIYLLMFVLVGAAGVVTLVDAIQRMIFYRVLRSVEYLNIKSKLTFSDRIIAFLFNIPEDMDTRNLTMDHDISRTKIPWKDVRETVMLGLMVGLFIWIYLSMNPSFMDLTNESSIPLFMFTLILYIPVIVLPWSIFKSLKVRIETNYRDFYIFNGINATLQRMAVPIIGALFFVLVAINTSDILTVAYYITLSAITIVVIVAFVSILYYWLFESVIVGDIISKWKLFRPVPIFVGLKEGEKKSSFDDVPGTPRRGKDDYGELIIPGNK